MPHRRHSADEREGATKPVALGRATRRVGIRILWATFAVFALVTVLITDSGSRIATGDPAALIRDFPQLRNSVEAPIGIAIAPVGGTATPLDLGDWHSGVAWSTIKVPLVIAALREEHPPHVTAEMTAAITRSDNAAAEAIWAGLGDPATAARKVEAVLAETGDSTRVQSARVRPEYTAFGQTEWSLTNQVRFLSAAACDSRNAPVLNLMGHVENDQRWGLGTIAGTRLKGGWGPSVTGGYLERQMGLIITPTGLSAVAVAAEPHSGSYADVIPDLNRVAQWLSDHLATLPGGHCRQ